MDAMAQRLRVLEPHASVWRFAEKDVRDGRS